MAVSSTSDTKEAEDAPVSSRAEFDKLSEEISIQNSTIVGYVVNCYPIQPSRVYGKYRKLVLRELMPDGTIGDKDLPCFLYGQFIDQTRDLIRGDSITVKDFEVSQNQFYDQDSNSKTYPSQIDVITSVEKQPTVIISKKKQLSFDDLRMVSKQYAGIYVLGCIVQSSNIYKSRFHDCIKSLTVEEVLPDDTVGNIKLDCILYGKIAAQHKMLKLHDYVTLSGFRVEARPSTSALSESEAFYPFHLVFNPVDATSTDVQPSINVVKKTKKVNEVGNLLKSNTSYKYTQLKDLKADLNNGHTSKRHYNVYGVVVRCLIENTLIKDTLRIVIRDPSLDSFTVFVSIGHEVEIFPDIRPHDIIRFHRMSVEQHRTSLNGYCHTINDIVVFSGSDPHAAPSHTSRKYTWCKDDEQLVEKLYVWKHQGLSGAKLNGECSEIGWSDTKKKTQITKGQSSEKNIPPDCGSMESYRNVQNLTDGKKQNDNFCNENHLQTEEKITLLITSTDNLITEKGNTDAVVVTPSMQESDVLTEKEQLGSSADTLQKHSFMSSTHSKQVMTSPLLSAEMIAKEKRVLEFAVPNSECNTTTITQLTLKTPTKNTKEHSTSNNTTPEKALPKKFSIDIAMTTPSKNTYPCVNIQPNPAVRYSSEVPMSPNKYLKKPVSKADTKRKRCSDVVENNTMVKQLCISRESSKSDASISDQTCVLDKPDLQHVVSDMETAFSQSFASDNPLGCSSSTYRAKIIGNELCYPVNYVSKVINACDQRVIPIKDLVHSGLHTCSRVKARIVEITPELPSIHKSVHLVCTVCQFLIAKEFATNLIFLKGRKRACLLCPKCSERKKSVFLVESFLFVFRLNDGSGAVNAYLFRKSAELFFKHVNPSDPNALHHVQQMLSSIKCESNCSENTSVMDCCLLKYNTPGGFSFQIIDTKLL